MKVSSVTMPERPFQILRDGNSCTVEFYDNVRASEAIDGVTGLKIPSWGFDKYALPAPFSPGLAAEIEADYTTWLQKAKDAELTAESQKVRDYRDNLLNTCDTVYCNAERWSAMTAEQQQAWEAYKQALRDITAQSGFPQEVKWPQKPQITKVGNKSDRLDLTAQVTALQAQIAQMQLNK